ATFSHRTKNTSTRSERTYPCRRTRRFGVMCVEQGARVRRRPWAGCTINMFEFEFPTGDRPLCSSGELESDSRRRGNPPSPKATWGHERSTPEPSIPSEALPAIALAGAPHRRQGQNERHHDGEPDQEFLAISR